MSINKKKVSGTFGSCKAQVFTTDFFMALFIFSVLIIVVIVSLNSYSLRLNEKTEYNDLITKTFQLSNVLVKNQGYPEDWTAENVQIIGLASDDRILSISKVDAFVDLPLNKIKDIFQTHDYNFYFNLKDYDGGVLKESGTSPLNVTKSAAVRRYVLYNNSQAVFNLMLWK